MMLLVARLAAACDGGFGRAIVGAKGEPQSPPAGQCMADPSECRPRVFEPLVVPAPPSFDLLKCGNVGLKCSPAASGRDKLENCDLDLVVGDFAAAAGLQSVRCTRATFTAPAGVSSFRFANFSFEQAELSFVASAPVTIELAASKLSNTRVELRGPVTLRLSEDSQVDNTQVVDTSTSGASLELIESSTGSLSVAGLRGELTVERSNLTRASLFASSVKLATTFLYNSSIAASSLDGVELQGKGLVLEVDSGSLSGADMKSVTLQRCGSMLLTNSTFYESVFGACGDKLRADRGTIGDSLVFGPVESHIMIWSSDTFGAGVPTSLESWQDDLDNSRFCDGVQRVTLSQVVTLACNVCQEISTTPELLFCQGPTATPSEPVNFVVVPPTFYSDAGDGIGRNPLCPVLELLPDCDPQPVFESPF